MGKETEQKQEIVNQGVHTYSQEEAYVWPEEPVLREQLEWFQDQKLALMVHWGVYNQLGMVASWALSDEDAEWSRKTVDWTDDGEVFKRQYGRKRIWRYGASERSVRSYRASEADHHLWRIRSDPVYVLYERIGMYRSDQHGSAGTDLR